MGGQSLGANMDLWGFFLFFVVVVFPPTPSINRPDLFSGVVIRI